MIERNSISQAIKSGKPIIIYHNEEDEAALSIPGEYTTLELYQELRKYATSDIAVMLPNETAQKIGFEYLSNSLELTAENDSLAQDIIRKSHAGPTFDFLGVKTGSADDDKVLAINELAKNVGTSNWDYIYKNFRIPGHVRTYIAKAGLLNSRIGHTELGVYLSLVSGLTGIMCMVTLRDPKTGHPLNREEAINFAKLNNIPMFFENDIVEVFKNYPVSKYGEISDYKPNANEVLADYSKMYFVRLFELELDRLFKEGKIKGSYHLSVGQEATGVALSKYLRPGDSVFVTHRGHHIALPLNIDTNQLFHEIIGSPQGLNQGVAGPMHFVSTEGIFCSSNGIVAANFPIAVGKALGEKINKTDSIVVNVVGEGSLDEGVTYESMKMAKLHNVPLLVICENNLYSQSTPMEKHLTHKNIADNIRDTYGVMTERIAFGTDINHLSTRLKNIVETVRKVKSPIFVEILTYRYTGHSMSDTAQEYKDKEIDSYWRNNDCLNIAKKILAEMELPSNLIEEQEAKAREKVSSITNTI